MNCYDNIGNITYLGTNCIIFALYFVSHSSYFFAVMKSNYGNYLIKQKIIHNISTPNTNTS